MIQRAVHIPEDLYNLTQLAEVTLAAGRLSTKNVIETRESMKKENNISDQINNIKYRSKRRTNGKKSWNSNSNSIDFQPKTSYEHSDMKGKLSSQTIRSLNNADSNGCSNFFHSSDEDSTYYSHKIFDRKKFRPSTTSENCLPSNSDEQSATNFNNSSNSSLIEDGHHICPECGKNYSTSSNLARHRQTHRSILDKKARRCPHCEKVYVSMPAYSMHVRTHNQGCECSYCGKCFSRPWLLQGHMRTHTGEKPFKCSICSKAFADKSNLRAHIQTHSNIKPHLCRKCGKAFALKSYLCKHEESSCMRGHLKRNKERIKCHKYNEIKSAITSVLKKDKHNKTVHSYKWKNAAVLINQNKIGNNTLKSYAILSSPMSQEGYDSFARISVIQSPIPNSKFDPSSQMNYYNESQDVISPQNNLTHSSRTNPFELTTSFTIIA